MSLSFSSDGRLLAVLGGGPEHTLGLWAWEKAKLLASVKATTMPSQAPAQCLLAPGPDPQQVSVVGEGLCRTFRIEGGLGLKPEPPLPLGKRDSQRYTCHTYLTDSAAKESMVGWGVGGCLAALTDQHFLPCPRPLLLSSSGICRIPASR